jgi:hypothetical protein
MSAFSDRVQYPAALRWIPASAWIVAGLSFLLLGCGGETARNEPGLEWNGSPLPVQSRTAVPDTVGLRTALAPISFRLLPKRVLRVVPGEWGDSLRVLEYRDELEAYAAFQELAVVPEEISMGMTVLGDWICIRRGAWLIFTDTWTWKGGEGFDQSLALPDAPIPTGLPQIFGSMVHQGRIPGSERILTETFLGLETNVPVFSVQVDCHGDTGWVYAAPKMRKEWAKNFRSRLSRMRGWKADLSIEEGRFTQESPDLLPVTVDFSSRGMVAVEACFDQKLTEYWLKMQARGLKSLK